MFYNIINYKFIKLEFFYKFLEFKEKKYVICKR